MTFLLYDAFALRVVLLVLAATLLIVAYLIRRLSTDSQPRAKVQPQPPPLPAPMEARAPFQAPPAQPAEAVPAPVAAREIPSEVPPTPPAALPAPAIPAPAREAPSEVPSTPLPSAHPPEFASERFTFRSLQTRSSFGWDLARAALIMLTVAVLLAGTLVALPEPVFERFAARLEPEPTIATAEKIALLFLGDEVRDQSFHIRGVVRNISKENIERLDANIRLYSHNSILMETAVARMDIEVIGIDAIAQFHLVYPAYTGQIGSYSIDFKLRQGDPVPYKDLRLEMQQR